MTVMRCMLATLEPRTMRRILNQSITNVREALILRVTSRRAKTGAGRFARAPGIRARAARRRQLATRDASKARCDANFDGADELRHRV
jgi:hypothetical protein